MDDKAQILVAIREVFRRWEELLAGLSEVQLTTPLHPSHLSIKDVMAHLRAWQQVSIARLEAAQQDREPEFPEWLSGGHPEAEGSLDTYNERIYLANRDLPWADVYHGWKAGFLRFLALAESIPDEDLLSIGRYAWLNEYPLSAVLLGSHGHHREHLEPLLAMYSSY